MNPKPYPKVVPGGLLVLARAEHVAEDGTVTIGDGVKFVPEGTAEHAAWLEHMARMAERDAEEE